MKFPDLIGNVDRPELEAWCRSKTQQAYLGHHTALARVLGTLMMYVDTRDLSLTPHMLMNGFWEMWVTEAICNYVKPGMRCIDVGANVGYFTLLLSELVGHRGLVRALEPQKGVFENLERSVALNGFTQAICERGAASDREGVASLRASEEWGGSASLHPWEGSTKQSQVPTRRLDSDLLQVDFVKIDAQGHELQVLEGMRAMILNSPSISIAMEFSPSEHSDPAKALGEAVQSHGLTLRTIGTDGVVRPIALKDAARADTGDHRMLWLSRLPLAPGT